MSLAVTYPLVLLLLPLAALPLIASAQEAEGYPSLDDTKTDTLSALVDLALRLLGSIAIVGLVLGLSGLYRLGQSIERLGEGANIVLLFDRSASMNDTFAGQAPTESGEESKSAAAERFLSDFVAKRDHDRFGVAAFSTSPMFVLPLSDHKEATLKAIDAIELPGLALTNVGKGLAMALSMHEDDILSTQGTDGGIASRAIVLVSDGAAVIDRKVQQKLAEAFIKRPVNLYWIFLRTEGARGIFDKPQKGDDDTPFAMPERHLNLFFEGLKIPYKAFEVENPAAVGEAVAAIDKLERRPMRYFERIPQKDLSGFAYGVAAGALLLLILAKLAETKLSPHAARPLLLVALIAACAVAPQPGDAAEVTREQLLTIIEAAGDTRPDLSRKDLTGLDLSGVDFKAADLFAANLSGSMAQGANFARANLNRVIANEADFSDANFAEASMFAVVMNGARLSGADLSKTRIIGEMKSAFLDKVKMVDADLGADPANQGMVPVRVDLSGVTLDGADLTGSNLVHTVLDFAKLRDTKLANTKFNWAKLSGADLTGADVAGADFTDADLDGAILTDLKGAASALGLPKAQ
jgi:mxaC protein